MTLGTEYIWSTSEKSYLRAQSLYHIRCIVQEYGGEIVKIDIGNYVLEINVPAKHRDECAMKMQEVMDRMTN